MKVIAVVFYCKRMRRTPRTSRQGRQKLMPLRFVNFCMPTDLAARLVLLKLLGHLHATLVLLSDKTRSNIVFVYLTDFVFDNLLFLVSSFSVTRLFTFTSGRIYPEHKTEVPQSLPNQNHSWPSPASPPPFLKDHAETAAVLTLENCFQCRQKPSAGVA